MSFVRSLMPIVLAWLVVQTPAIATACTVCTAGRDEENAAAFLLSTIFMSLTPLIAIGSIVYLLFRRIRKFEEEASARRESGPALLSTDRRKSIARS